ncbi:hypothetical protein [Desulfobacula sp.]
MYSRKQALALARQLRTCPPPDIRGDADYSRENKKHMEICPFCSTNLKDEINAWSILSEKFQKKFKLPALQSDDKNIQAGQIWVLNKNLCCWRDDYYYNEPIVIILNDQCQIDDDILVAQTWHDLSLASPGDLVVPEIFIQGCDEFFIETWNIYTLKKQSLGQYLGNVTNDVVVQTLKMHKTPDIPPDWALRLMPLGPDDPRQYFQKLEIETGYTFSIQAVNELMKKQVNGLFSFAGDSVDTLIARIKELMADIEWFWQPETIEECLALIRFAPEDIALSAAADDRKEIIAACFGVRNGAIKTVQPFECIVLHETSSNKEYRISGEIPALPTRIGGLSFKCFISDGKNRLLTSGKWYWDDNTNHFLAHFDRAKEKHERISIIIIDTVSERDRP